MPDRPVKRGEIYYYDFGRGYGSVQGGKRPALVVQDDKANARSSTTVVVPLTRTIRKAWLDCHVLLDKDCGLTNDSMAMIEQIRAVNQADLADYIGRISEPMQRMIDKSLRNSLGGYRPKR